MNNKTLWQIRDSIMEAIHSYEITDDSNIEPDIIDDKIVDLRSTLINEEHKTGILDQGYYQAIDNLEVVFGNHTLVISDNITLVQAKKIGVVTIPGLNTRIGRKAISYLGVADYSYNFDHKTVQGLLASAGGIYTKNRYQYAISGTKAFVKNYGLDGKRYVSVLAILDDPRMAPGFNFKTSDFPVSDPQKLELLVIKHFLSTLGYAPDKINDANVNLQQPQQQQ